MEYMGYFLAAIFIFAIIYQFLFVSKTCPHCKHSNHKNASVCNKCTRDIP